MREIPGRRRRPLQHLLRRRRGAAPVTQLDTALTCATRWHWPVVPGVGLQTSAGAEHGCACPDPGCPVPGAHPLDPVLLAATTDARMVRWWWQHRPAAPVVLATGGRAPCALSLPAVAGARALDMLQGSGVRPGPVVASATRWSFLVAPYSLELLGEMLNEQDWVPSSLRFHGDGGYLVLPPSPTGAGRVRWERGPVPGSAAPWLPRVDTLVDALVEASASAPDAGSRLAP